MFQKPMILLSSVSHAICSITSPDLIGAKALGNITATVKAIYHDRKFLPSTSELPEGTAFGVLLDKTSFYAEAGGQEYDTGNIVIDGVTDFEVEDVQVFNGYVLHIGSLKYGQLKVGDEVVSSYDEVRLIIYSGGWLLIFEYSFAAGHSGITTPLHTFLTGASEKCSETT